MSGASRPRHPLLDDLSAGTLDRLALFEAMLRRWQPVINLIGDATLDAIWIRHFADSIQISDAAPDARRWLDLGSGAGFPGLVTAIRYADDPGASVHLIESDQRKCAFLRGVSRETGARAIVHCARIEAFLPTFDAPVDAISARALAPLPVLLAHAGKLIENGAIGVFSEGQLQQAELTHPALTDRFSIMTAPSLTSSSSRIVIVKGRSRED